jgi:predicted Zn-dependent protease
MTDYVHRVSDEERERIRRFLRVSAIVTVGIVVLVIVAVLTARHWVTVISPESERKFVQPYISWLQSYVIDGAEPVLQNYVDRLGRDIAADMELSDGMELEFHVVEGSTINAFTTLGGYIFVFDGLVRELESENGLAMVLAHEIAHAANRDPLTAASRGILIQVLLSALSGNRGVDSASAGELGGELMLGIYSREQEEDADRLALEALQRRYGHVGGATHLFETLRYYYGDDEIPEILSSHPDTVDRIDALNRYADSRGWVSGETDAYPPDVRDIVRPPP